MIDYDTAVFKDGHSFSLPKKRTTLITTRKQKSKKTCMKLWTILLQVWLTFQFFFLFFFFFRYDDINEWLNNEEPNAFLWMLTDYLSADGLISCWVHVLYDSTAPCPGLSPPATSRPGIPVLVQRSHCFRSSATSLLPVLLSFCSFLCSSVLSYLCVSVFFNAYSCPCVRVRLPSAVSLGESLPEITVYFFYWNTLTKTFWGLRPNPD